MLKTFIPENNPETPFNTRTVKSSKKKKDGSFNQEAVYVVGTLQATYQKNARMWQIIALVSLTSFFISLGICIYAIRLPKTVPVIVTVDNEGYASYVGKVDKSYWGHSSIPENAKTYQLKKLIANMYTWVIDSTAQHSYINECGAICQGQAIDQLDTFFRQNNPFDFIGRRTQSVKIEEPLKQTDRTYVIYYNVLTYERGSVVDNRRFSMLATLDYFQGTPETNPLGIYISNFDIKPVTVR